MKNVTKVLLGVLTSVGGYLEVGSLGTALQAGSSYRYELLWPIALGTVCIACCVEMSGRLAAVSKETVYSAAREHFGFTFQFWPVAAQILVDLFVLAAEIGGASLALELMTGISMQLWAMPVTFLIWVVLWRGTFGIIENSVAVLGLVTLSFIVAATRLHPDWSEVARGLIPHRSSDDPTKYAYFAVSILGATISPYMISFYSSGVIEEKWKTSDLAANRISAGLGMTFGSMIGMSVVVVAALTLAPRGIARPHISAGGGRLEPAAWPLGFLALLRVYVRGLRGRCVRAGARRQLRRRADVWLEMGRRSNARRRGAVCDDLYRRSSACAASNACGRRSAEVHDGLDVAHGPCAAARRRTVAGADERPADPENPRQRVVLEPRRRRGHPHRGRLSAGGHSPAGAW